VDLQVEDVQRIMVEVPYRAVPRRNMVRELPQCTIFEICKVRLRSGVVGWGETLFYHTWGHPTDEAVGRVRGGNAAALMWDDSLGAGLQMALLDAVAKSAGVPLHALLGQKVRDSVPLSWWAIDMPPGDLASECEALLAAGYSTLKTKGRPWFDLHRQLDAVASVVPAGFRLALDFNNTIPNADVAESLLPEIEQRWPFVDVFETPIRQSDVPGGKRLKAMTRVPVAMHYGEPAPRVAVCEGICDCFVLEGGATGVMAAGRAAGEMKMPCWLQLVGTGITAAFSLHLGAVLPGPEWPSVNCHQVYEHDLLAAPISVEDGAAAVPCGPGIGRDIDEGLVERLRISRPVERPPGPKRLIVTKWPTGEKSYFTHGEQMAEYFGVGERPLPIFAEGTTTGVVFEDGSAGFASRHAEAARHPVHESAPR
jgi:galactonate dehydratase